VSKQGGKERKPLFSPLWTLVEGRKKKKKNPVKWYFTHREFDPQSTTESPRLFPAIRQKGEKDESPGTGTSRLLQQEITQSTGGHTDVCYSATF